MGVYSRRSTRELRAVRSVCATLKIETKTKGLSRESSSIAIVYKPPHVQQWLSFPKLSLQLSSPCRPRNTRSFGCAMPTLFRPFSCLYDRWCIVMKGIVIWREIENQRHRSAIMNQEKSADSGELLYGDGEDGGDNGEFNERKTIKCSCRLGYEEK
jgi:hypothetical protein